MRDSGTKGLRGSPEAGQRRRRPRVRRAAPQSLNPSIPQSLNPFAFTLIEVLVVIVVIGILIAAIGLVGHRAMYSQKIRVTETTMKTVKQAIDQFATQNPLGAIYNRRDAATFGPYPPYQIANAGAGVAWALEPNYAMLPNFVLPAALDVRIAHDLAGTPANLTVGQWASLANDRGNDDIRAVYAYLKLYAPSELSQIPNTALKPLTNTPEYVNAVGKMGDPNSTVDVLGIHDAWGVPLDYFLYVKLEWSMAPPGSAFPGVWRVTDRQPVLRSRGISHEEYVQELQGTDEYDPDKWIFSDPFPTPASAAVNRATGALSGGNSNLNGWARAIGAGDVDPNGTFGYVP